MPAVFGLQDKLTEAAIFSLLICQPAALTWSRVVNEWESRMLLSATGKWAAMPNSAPQLDLTQNEGDPFSHDQQICNGIMYRRPQHCKLKDRIMVVREPVSNWWDVFRAYLFWGLELCRWPWNFLWFCMFAHFRLPNVFFPDYCLLYACLYPNGNRVNVSFTSIPVLAGCIIPERLLQKCRF